MYQIQDLYQEQLNVFYKLENTQDNYYVTGKAGTGKSHLLKTFVDNTKKRTAVIAPTGIAAINVNGQTIHSFFGLSTAVQNPQDPEMLHKGLSEKRKSLLRSLDAIIIDEISMVRVDIMDMIDYKLRVARSHNEPFGGCQMILFGDLFQLPPVVSDDEVKDYLENKYHTSFFFGAPGCVTKELIRIELTEVVRQKDPVFVNALNQIRIGSIDEQTLSSLNQCANKNSKDRLAVTLTPTNEAANRINQEKLDQLPGKTFRYQGAVEGNFKVEDLPTDYTLSLKVGAQIMMIKNDQLKRYVNGSVGIISELNDDFIKVRIKGQVFSVDKEVWAKYIYRLNPATKTLDHVQVGSFRQYPIRLAYAITIHKSQGKTYDAVCVDYSKSRAFSAGQTYVALSRCKSLDGLYLTTPIVQDDVKVSQEIISFTNGTLQLPPIETSFAPPERKKHTVPFHWNEDNSIKLDSDITPKKITGSKLAGVLNLDRFHSPFEAWCDLMRVYKRPISDEKYINAGKVIQPKQFEFVKKQIDAPGRTFVSPSDLFGEEPEEASNYDFFSYKEVFGGMWDYLIEEHGKIASVLEMKTKGAKNRQWNETHFPTMDAMQAALYAYLLGLNTFYLITSYVEEQDYAHPEQYQCNLNNTSIHKFYLDQVFPGLKQRYLDPAYQWWKQYVETGLSPAPNLNKKEDREIVEALQKQNKF